MCNLTLASLREIKDLESIATVVSPDVSSKQAFLDEVTSKHTDAVAIYATNGSKVGGYSKEVIEKLPPSIKYICSNGELYPLIWLWSCLD